MGSMHVRPVFAYLAVLSLTTTAASVANAAPPPSAPLQTVVANDNRHPAGTFDDGTLTLALKAGRGAWRPEGPQGPALSIEAFGETAADLTVPAPLIRVEEGTTIVASIRNDLEAGLLVHGLCARDGAACPPVSVSPGETRWLRFSAGRPGTYHYWATTMGAPVPFRELSGAFVVDPPGGAIAADRVFVITEWTSLTPDQLRDVMTAVDSGEVFSRLKPRLTFMINGLSWPATERLTYPMGEPVHWRIINLSSQAHPMHLHGFYFEVDSLGDGRRDLAVEARDKHHVVTQLLQPESTMSMTWTPQRIGNWLFHCHIMAHVSPERRLSESAPPAGHHHADHDASAGMAGMILGITVVAPEHAPPPGPAPDAPPARKLTLVLARGGSTLQPSFGFVLSGDRVPPGTTPDRVASPGPALVLHRDEPVEITVVNRLGESTALHWHGIELDSFYDGVHGWSGSDRRVAPMIEPDQDGAPMPVSAQTRQPARQAIAVGETYDFEIDLPPSRQNVWIKVRSTAGKWLAQGHVVVR